MSSSSSSSSPSGASIGLRNLSKFYGEICAARDINLNVAAGEFLTLLGPSGSGKTTTLMMIAGFTIPTSGDVRVNDQSIVQVPVHRRNIGMVFQNYALFPHLDVNSNIAFPLEMRGVSKREIAQRVERALDLVRLRGFGDRRPKQLSGGQQQRVALARALVFEPNVLLLDEPLGALDAKLREEMKYELKQLHHKVGATILFVTHDQEEALTLSDRIAVFEEGTLAQVGTPSELYQAPANRFVADFIGETNLLTGKFQSLRDGRYHMEMPGGLELVGSTREGFAVPKSWATYTLRLEKITVGPEANRFTNSFEGRIEEFLYIGDATKYRVRLSPDWSVTVRVPEQAGQQQLPPGTKVGLGWSDSDMLLVETDVPPALSGDGT